MINLNRVGAGVTNESTPSPLHQSLHPKLPSNHLSIYFLLIGEGVKGYRNRNESLKKDGISKSRKFGDFNFHPLPSPSPLHYRFAATRTQFWDMPCNQIKEHKE
jgi:hypothetical protein